GPNPGYIDEICTFTTKTIDADGDNVCYKFDCGDGTPFSKWTSSVTSGNPGRASYTYRKLGTFYVKAQAKDEPGAVSEWSDAMAITIKVGPGAIWVADCSGGQPPNDSGEVVKLGKGGSRICSYGFHRPTLDSSAHPHFQGPWRLAVDPQDGDVWIACSFGIDRVFKLSVNGKYKGMLIPETTCPSTPCVDNNGDCWIPLVDGKKIIKLARLPVGLDIIKIGEILDNLGNMIYPIAIALDIDSNWIWVVESSMAGGYVSKFDGSPPHSRLLGPLGGFKATWAEVDPVTHYCWVADGGSNLVKKISPAGQITPYSGSGFSEPACLSVNPNTHEIWVADKNNNRVVKLSEIGEERCVVGGLSFPMAVEVDPNDGSCWIADPGSMKVIKVDAVGGFLFEVTGFTEPAGLSLNPNADL
ncbi:MAG: PKD domain-containing protein, partial [Candidatus Stahlbacteria bacterium]|nr:PKD domain-containing protein [Candidatus Stahlbacteria bacterium]